MRPTRTTFNAATEGGSVGFGAAASPKLGRLPNPICNLDTAGEQSLVSHLPPPHCALQARAKPNHLTPRSHWWALWSNASGKLQLLPPPWMGLPRRLRFCLRVGPSRAPRQPDFALAQLWPCDESLVNRSHLTADAKSGAAGGSASWTAAADGAADPGGTVLRMTYVYDHKTRTVSTGRGILTLQAVTWPLHGRYMTVTWPCPAQAVGFSCCRPPPRQGSGRMVVSLHHLRLFACATRRSPLAAHRSPLAARRSPLAAAPLPRAIQCTLLTHHSPWLSRFPQSIAGLEGTSSITYTKNEAAILQARTSGRIGMYGAIG